MTQEQSELLLSGLRKVTHRMDELQAQGVIPTDMQPFEVTITLGEMAVITQLAQIGLEVYDSIQDRNIMRLTELPGRLVQ